MKIKLTQIIIITTNQIIIKINNSLIMIIKISGSINYNHLNYKLIVKLLFI